MRVFELLCALAGAELAPERIERIANWNLSALDWSEVLRLAEHHGVLPLAARNLIEHGRAEQGRGIPPEIECSLRSAYEANLSSLQHLSGPASDPRLATRLAYSTPVLSF